MRRVCWDQTLVRQLFTTEADTKLTRESLLRLHQPFDRIRVLASKPYVFVSEDLAREADEQFVSEQGLLRAFSAVPLSDPNRIFVLTGEPGSGKSHLARWLCHMLEGVPNRAVIHIPRRINSLVDVLKRLSDEVGLWWDLEPSSYLVEAPPAKVVRYLLAYLDMAVGAGTPIGQQLPLLARLVSRAELESVLSQQVARYQAARKVGTADGVELIMVPEEDFVRMSPGGTLPERTEAYAALRHQLTEALRKLTNLDRFDLRAEMERISSAFVTKGQRPVLILEDITSFDLLHDDLLTFLLDEAAGHFDALVCWTTGYEKAYMRTYQLDRYAARLSLSDANMEVYALQGDGFRKMVKGYLDVVKPWCKRGVCDLYDRCVPAFEGLYPFNQHSVERIYENLIGSDQQHRRTPRNLLDRAIKSYLEVAEGHGSFPPMQQPPVVRDILYEDQLFQLRHTHPAFVSLMAWYGVKSENTLTLDTEVAHLLGIAVPPQYIQGDSIRVPLEDERVIPQVEEAVVSVPSEVPAASAHVKAPAQLQKATKQLAVSNRLKELRLEVQMWSTTLKTPPHALDMTRALHRLLGLFKYRFPVPLGHPHGPIAGISYGKQQGESNLTLAGTKGKLTPAIQMMITPADVAASGRFHEVWNAALALHVSGELPPDTDMALLADWSQARYHTYRQETLDRLEAVLGMRLEEWALSARWTLLALLTGTTEPTYGELVSGTVPAWLPADLRVDGCYWDEATKALGEVGRVVEGLFTVAKGTYDAPRVLRTIKALDPWKFLKSLASVPHTRIDADYRVGILIQFRDLVKTVKNAAALVLQAEVAAKAAVVNRELALMEAGLSCEPQSLRGAMEDIRRLIGLTERYDLYDPVVGTWWDEGQGDLSQADTLKQEVVRGRNVVIEDAWSYLGLARRVSVLREVPALRAAYAAAYVGALLESQLELLAACDVVGQLQAAATKLHGEVRLPFIPVDHALDCIEMEVKRRKSEAAWDALTTLRQELIAGD